MCQDGQSLLTSLEPLTLLPSNITSKVMEIRKLQMKDFSDISTLCGELGYPSRVDKLQERWKLLQGSQFEDVLVIVVPEGKVVGFAHVSCEFGITSDPRGILRSLVISEEFRSKKLGSMLLAAAEKSVLRMGPTKIRVGSQIKREDAHRFYKNQGYELLKSWHLFEKKISKSED